MLTEDQCADAVVYNERRNYSMLTIEQIQVLVGTKADGTWGENSVRAVAVWQDRHRLVVDGKVGPTTFGAMKDEMSGDVSRYPIMHPLPVITSMWGYDHCPNTYKKPCPIWHDATKDPTLVNGLLRLVSGGHDKRDRFSRSPDSWISLDEMSIGFAHWWAETAPKILARIANELPGLAAHAWGTTSVNMRSVDWLQSQIRAKRGKRAHQAKYDWLLAGWWEIGLHPDVIELCAKQWVQDYTPPGVAMMRKQDWHLARTLAGLVRVTNSRGAGGMKSLVKRAIQAAGHKDEKLVLPILFESESLYNHPERWETIMSLSHFEGNAPRSVSLDDFRPDRDLAVRVDGSTPSWVSKGL